MRFLENTDLLKIEDILPFFPDFVVIDDFKEEICTALEGYSAHIDALKAEMDEATRNAESIKQDIAGLKKRFITIDAAEKCSVCGLLLLSRQFYVFPCLFVDKGVPPRYDLHKIANPRSADVRDRSS